MKKIKRKSLLTTASFGVVASLSTGILVHANNEGVNINYENLIQTKSTDKQEQPYHFLSDIGYIEEQSRPGWGNITLDSNLDGNKISLKTNEETLTFDKGFTAHATSTVVFDISMYSNKYTRFTTYLGVDASQAGRGNGVLFTIYKSMDGNTWEVAYQSDEAIDGNNDSVFIDIDVKDVKYLKFYADANGSNGNDHAAYGSPRLLLPDYDITSEYIGGILKTKEYDEIIKEKYEANNEVLTEEIQHLLLKRELVNRVGFNTLQKALSTDQEHYEAISWLINNPQALEIYITGGTLDKNATYTQSLDVFTTLYHNYFEDFLDVNDGDFYLRLAISLSLSHAAKVTFWSGNTTTPSEATVRYEIYKKNLTEGRIAMGGDANAFKKLPVELMRWVVNSQISDEEIDWLIDYSLTKKALNKNYLDAYEYIEYTFDYNYNDSKFYDPNNFDMWNEKYNIGSLSGYGVAGNHRLWMVFEDGSVCGGLAKTYANLGQVFGRPSAVIGQPGHGAAIAYSQNDAGLGVWSIQNDVSGWTQSEKGERLLLGWGSNSEASYYNVSYVILAQHALNNYDDYLENYYYNLLAKSYVDEPQKQIEIYNQALKIQEYNLDSWLGLIKAYKKIDTKTSEDYYQLALRIADAFSFFPLPFVDLMTMLESNITDGNYLAMFDILKGEVLERATNATSDDTTQPRDCITMARYLLGNYQVDLATFSFDGENAGQIVLDEKYETSDVRWSYSLDNWKTSTEASSHIITLSPEEISQINSKDDVQISLIGTNEIYIIDITEQEAPNIYVNDLENQIKGTTAPLEYSVDNGQTWTLYEDQRILGDQTLKIRYRASGTSLQSEETECSFTEDIMNESRKYIPLSEVSIHRYSSQNNSSEHAAINMIDGNIFTGWHNSFSGESLKYYSVEFNDAKYLTSIDYYGDGGNGKFKDVDIYTSMDGVTWELNTEIRNLSNDSEWKTLNLDQPSLTKYVMLHLVNTHGARPNEFASGKMLNFYEDKTYEDVEASDIKVTYSESSYTNQDVTATVTLPEGYTMIGDSTYTFTSNGRHTFTYQSKFGTEYTYSVEVDWINKETPIANVSYSTKSETDKPVIAFLTLQSIDGKEIIVTNNRGSNEFTFDKNGEFTFEYTDKYGNVGTTTAIVDWIVEHSEDDEDITHPPVVENPPMVIIPPTIEDPFEEEKKPSDVVIKDEDKVDNDISESIDVNDKVNIKNEYSVNPEKPIKPTIIEEKDELSKDEVSLEEGIGGNGKTEVTKDHLEENDKIENPDDLQIDSVPVLDEKSTLENKEINDVVNDSILDVKNDVSEKIKTKKLISYVVLGAAGLTSATIAYLILKNKKS